MPHDTWNIFALLLIELETGLDAYIQQQDYNFMLFLSQILLLTSRSGALRILKPRHWTWNPQADRNLPYSAVSLLTFQQERG